MSPYGTTQRFESPVDSVDIATRPALKGVDKGVDGLEAAQKLADTRKAAHPLTHPPAPCPPCPQGQGNKVLNKRGKEKNQSERADALREGARRWAILTLELREKALSDCPERMPFGRSLRQRGAFRMRPRSAPVTPTFSAHARLVPSGTSDFASWGYPPAVCSALCFRTTHRGVRSAWFPR